MVNEDKLSEFEIQTAAGLLARLEPGFLPYPIFEQIARLVALPILEIIPLRTNAEGNTEVLLIERPGDDALFAGLLHTPGTVIRATDLGQGGGTRWPALDRVLQDELEGTEVGDPYFVGSMLHTSKRGAEQAQLYWVEVRGEPKVGSFYPVAALPDNLMESQRDFIVQAVQSFEAFKRSTAEGSHN